jgi:hypothetical protein
MHFKINGEHALEYQLFEQEKEHGKPNKIREYNAKHIDSHNITPSVTYT